MTDPNKPLATNVEYQGFPCSPLFEIRRSVGLDPDFCFVHVAKQDLGKIAIQDPPGGFDKAIEFLADLSNPTGPGKLYRVGDVLLQDLEDSVEGPTVRFRKMLLDEGTVEAVAATDGDGDGLVRLGLTDIRKLWDQGATTAWINMPRQSTYQDPTNPLATADLERFVPGSTDAGKPWTVRRVLEVKVLPFLPGKPPLHKLSDSLENRECGPHLWQAKKTKDAFREILNEVDAVCALNPDSSVSVWRRGDGELQDLDGTVISSDADSIASKRILLSHRVSVPDTVLVVGRPIVETVVETLVAVGEVNFTPGQAQLLPLAQAFAQTNVPEGATPKAILLGHERRRAAGLDDGATLAFEKWAYRWFCLASFMAGKKTQVPVENCAETDQDGQRLPPIVRARGVRGTSVRMEAAISAGTVKRLKSAGAGGSLIPDNVDLRTLDPSNGLVVFNVPESLQGDGSYRIDNRRGLVEFSAPRVQVTQDGTPIAEASIRPAEVTLTFGVSRKPAPDEPLKLEDRYFSMWTYFGSRGPESEDLGQVGDQLGKPLVVKVKDEDVPKVDLSRVVVVEEDLQLLVTLDKRNNRGALDGIAQTIAEPLILANRFVPGAVIELVGVASVAPTGRILSVVWSGDVNRPPRTEAHDGQPAPLRAQPRPLSLDDIRRGASRVGLDSVGTRLLGYLPGAKGG